MRHTGSWSELELRRVLELALPELGLSVEAALLRDLTAWAAARLARKRLRSHEWGAGGWSRKARGGGWCSRRGEGGRSRTEPGSPYFPAGGFRVQ